MPTSPHLLLLLCLIFAYTASAGPIGYGICQAGCAAVVTACYSAAGFTWGATLGATAPATIIACNSAFGASAPEWYAFNIAEIEDTLEMVNRLLAKNTSSNVHALETHVEPMTSSTPRIPGRTVRQAESPNTS
ncbi:hypothetical protein OPT61_g1646 [Boeremia exigua]|uniref:Uncharacterized protein n=1 Tax=Boeremia exigua TaxID=749465 RepID=A0ACC2IPD1_9PLEO|nr:hypothetical protein OPT61_g1646 [Boeremia exigua]